MLFNHLASSSSLQQQQQQIQQPSIPMITTNTTSTVIIQHKYNNHKCNIPNRKNIISFHRKEFRRKNILFMLRNIA